MHAALTILMTFAPGCGSEDTHGADPPEETNDAGDPKIYPEPNGQHVGEEAACDALLAGQESRILALGCSITTRTCPSLLRVMFVTACLEYDDGSVQGCIAHYKAQSTCEALSDAIANCVVTAYPGTEPNGCPPP